MKAVIVFHSVCGNDYLIAKAFETGLKAEGHHAGLFRVADADWVEKPDTSSQAKNVLAAMRQVPEAAPSVLLEADLIIMGSPTYFGNVSAEMKTFMDQTGGLWIQAKLAGKKFFAFTSAGNTEGGGALCLQTLHTYAHYMGMHSISMPVNICPGENVSALGIIQYSNGKYAEALQPGIERMVRGMCDVLSRA